VKEEFGPEVQARKPQLAECIARRYVFVSDVLLTCCDETNEVGIADLFGQEPVLLVRGD
jgi:hypothetical protein